MASLSRVKDYKEETIRNWLQQAAEHAAQVENVLMREYEIERGQLDALWSYVGCKKQESEEGKKDPPDGERGIYWRSTMIDVDTRLRVGRGIAKTSGCGLRGGFSGASAKSGTSRQTAPDDQRRLGRDSGSDGSGLGEDPRRSCR